MSQIDKIGMGGSNSLETIAKTLKKVRGMDENKKKPATPSTEMEIGNLTDAGGSFGDLLIKKSGVGQFKDGLGVYANRDFKKGEILIKWNLKILTEDEYLKLPEYERNNFCHQRKGILYSYPEPGRHVNRSTDPTRCNLLPDFEKEVDIAQREIKKGEELVISDAILEDF